MANIAITVNEIDDDFLKVNRLKTMTVAEIQGTAFDTRNATQTIRAQDIDRSSQDVIYSDK